jgi:hypothetical protein
MKKLCILRILILFFYLFYFIVEHENFIGLKKEKSAEGSQDKVKKDLDSKLVSILTKNSDGYKALITTKKVIIFQIILFRKHLFWSCQFPSF